MAKKDLTASLKRNTREMTTTEQPVSPPDHPDKRESSDSLIESPKSISEDKKKKVGRPKVKTEPEKTINISVPISIIEKMNVAKVRYENNLTKYVNAVIKADLDANYERYLEMQRILNG